MAKRGDYEVRKHCPGNCGSEHMRADFDIIDGVRVNLWKCGNCGATLPRRDYKVGTGRTPIQTKRIEEIRSHMLRRFVTSGEVEIKREEVRDYPTFVSYVIETGAKGDEGTMASVFCRELLHVMITRKGAIHSYNPKSEKADKDGNVGGSVEYVCRWGRER